MFYLHINAPIKLIILLPTSNKIVNKSRNLKNKKLQIKIFDLYLITENKPRIKIFPKKIDFLARNLVTVH